MDNDKTIVWRTEKRKISELEPAPYNPRELTEKQAQDLSLSLERFNLADPIVINTNNRIIGGHQRINILKAKVGNNGFEVDVRVPSRKLTDHEEKELNLRLNKNLGQWDFDALANFDEDLLKDVGFDSKELDRIFQLEDKPEDDEIPPERAETGVVLGDLYQLGEHRLLCGDSVKKEDVERLMAGEKANMVFTDPPYNIDYSGRGKETSNKIENDNLLKEDFVKFLTFAFENYASVLRGGGVLYCCYASRTHREFEDALNIAGFEVKNQIIWVKLVASMGWGDYRWKHEPIFYCHRKNEKTEFYGDRKEYTTWEEEKNDEELLKFIKSLIRKEENGNSTVWRFHRDSNYKHPTQKPVVLVEKALINSSEREGIIIDFFGGSGTTLIACEKLNRKCRMMEIDPVYCQVIIDRWEKFTGKKAEKINVDSNSNELVGSGSKHLQA